MKGIVKIAWAKGAGGQPKHIKDADNGKACNCTCYSCGGPLIAVQGKSGKRRWHYAHARDTRCDGMTALHYVAQYLFTTKPELQVPLPAFSIQKYEHRFGDTFDMTKIDRAQAVSLQSAQLEKRFGDKIVDVAGEDANGKQYIFEIKVTHAKSPEDIATFKAMKKLHVIEIDLSDLPYDAELCTIRAAVFGTASNRTYLAHPLEEFVEVSFEQWKQARKNQLLNRLEECRAKSHRTHYTYRHNFPVSTGHFPYFKKASIEISEGTTPLKYDENYCWYFATLHNGAPVVVLFKMHPRWSSELTMETEEALRDFIARVAGKYPVWLTSPNGSEGRWFNVAKWGRKAHAEGKQEVWAREVRNRSY